MIQFILVLAGLTFAFGSLMLFLAWVVREHAAANKYRVLERAYAKMQMEDPIKEETKPKGGWKVTYRVGAKRKSIVVQGKTEGEAMLAFAKDAGTGFDNIISMEQI